jgi:hypothetical protein
VSFEANSCIDLEHRDQNKIVLHNPTLSYIASTLSEVRAGTSFRTELVVEEERKIETSTSKPGATEFDFDEARW